MAVDHHARTVGILDLEHAAILQLRVGIHAAFLERLLDSSKRVVGARSKVAFIHALTLDFMRLLPLLLALALAAGGCGQRGPLYLRDNPPPGMKPEKRDTYKPVPYPRQAPEETER